MMCFVQDDDWSEAEGWGGEESSIEQVPDAVNQLELEISSLRQQINALEAAKQAADTEVNNSKLKNGKLLVKVKALTKQVESLKKAGGGGSVSDDLDRALEEEMHNQVSKAKVEVKEIKAELETLKAEKSALEKRADTLESANDRLVEMKEQQDVEVEFLRTRNKEIKGQVDGLQWQLAEVEERSRTELADLQVALSAYEEHKGEGADGIMAENARLRQELAVSCQELTSAQQTADQLRDELAVLAASLNSAREEVGVWKSHSAEAREVLHTIAVGRSSTSS